MSMERRAAAAATKQLSFVDKVTIYCYTLNRKQALLFERTNSIAYDIDFALSKGIILAHAIGVVILSLK